MELLYHYTNIDALKNILQKNPIKGEEVCFWLSYSQCMNDDMEISIGQRIMNDIRNNSGIDKGLFIEKDIDDKESYILSLSSELYSSKMWSDYGEIAIGLNMPKAITCIYINEQDIDDFTSKIIRIIQNTNCFEEFFSIAFNITLFPYIMKNTKWEKEQEKRLCLNLNGEEVKYRKNKSGARVKYIEKYFSKDILKEIRLSSNSSNEIEQEIQFILNDRKINIPIYRVKIQ